MSDTKPTLVVDKVIINTDGGCRPGGRGDIGWGIHGQVTFKGKDAADYDYSFEHYGGYKGIQTNNFAELTAATNAIQRAYDEKFPAVQIRTDSMYVINGTKRVNKWKEAGWVNVNNEPIKNAEGWDKYHEVATKLKDAGVDVSYKWVKGHNGDIGNEKADELATRGVFLSKNGDYSDRYEMKLTYPKDEKGKAIKEPKYKVKYNRCILHSKWYFWASSTNPKMSLCNNWYVYHMGKSSDDDLNGKRAADTVNSVTFLPEPDKVLEAVRTRQVQISGKANCFVVTCQLRNLFRPKVHQEVMKYATDYMTRPGLQPSYRKEEKEEKGKGNWRFKDDIYKDDMEITYFNEPPRESFILMDELAVLEMRLSQFLANDLPDSATINDITDVIYTEVVKVNAKGKSKSEWKVAPAVQPPNKGLVVPIKYKDVTNNCIKETTINMALSMDIPSRDNFSGILKATKTPPKVYMLTIMDTMAAFRFFTIIDAGENGKVIYAPSQSNQYILVEVLRKNVGMRFDSIEPEDDKRCIKTAKAARNVRVNPIVD